MLDERDGLRLVAGRDELVREVVADLRLDAADARAGQLAELPAQPLDELRRRLDRHEVGLREVAVVVRLLLRAVHGQPVGVRVVVVGRLLERLAALVRGDLLAHGGLDAAADEA